MPVVFGVSIGSKKKERKREKEKKKDGESGCFVRYLPTFDLVSLISMHGVKPGSGYII
jgi:hypothetical protein